MKQYTHLKLYSTYNKMAVNSFLKQNILQKFESGIVDEIGVLWEGEIGTDLKLLT